MVSLGVFMLCSGSWVIRNVFSSLTRCQHLRELLASELCDDAELHSAVAGSKLSDGK
jgi:hypothetical protein